MTSAFYVNGKCVLPSHTSVRPLLHGLYGMGDQVVQRAVLRQAPKLFLKTPFPEFYSDLPQITCVLPEKEPPAPQTPWKCWQGQSGWQPLSFWDLAASAPMPFGYEPSDLTTTEPCGLLPGYLRRASRLRYNPGSIFFDLPPLPKSPHPGCVIVRPATLRSNGHFASRLCLPEYLVLAASLLRAAGHKVVSLANVRAGQEWFVGPEPEADFAYHHGELSTLQFLALFKEARAIVTPQGIGYWLALATKTPAAAIYGGYGGKDCPSKLLRPRGVGENIAHFLPDNFCFCVDMQHKCGDKRISSFAAKFLSWASFQGLL